MSEAITIRASQEDQRAIWRSMQAARDKLDGDNKQAVMFAAWAVASGCAAKTRTAKKYRPYRQVSKKTSRRPGVYRVTVDRKGQAKTYTTSANSVAELKQQPIVRIGRHGLAKAAWLWALSDAAQKGKGLAGPKFPQQIAAMARRQGQKHGGVELRGSQSNPGVLIENRLDYAMDALNGGQAALDGVIGRSARRMMHIINANVRKRMGAK